jgi:hypothetical protein
MATLAFWVKKDSVLYDKVEKVVHLEAKFRYEDGTEEPYADYSCPAEDIETLRKYLDGLAHDLQDRKDPPAPVPISVLDPYEDKWIDAR